MKKNTKEGIIKKVKVDSLNISILNENKEKRRKHSNFLEPLLALDPSLNCTGYCVFIGGELVDFGKIQFEVGNGSLVEEKLYKIDIEICNLIEKYKIKVVVMEQFFLIFNRGNTSLETSKALPKVRGVIERLLFSKGVKFLEINAATVKKIVSGNGHATKPQVRKDINDFYQLILTSKDEDVSDAIACADSFFRILSLNKNSGIEFETVGALDFLEKYFSLKNKTNKSLIGIGCDSELIRLFRVD